jgi:uncharacterized protein YggT (Ycf19 family)
MPLVKQAMDLVILVMIGAIFGSVIISWLRMIQVRVPYGSPLVRAIEGTADLMLRPIRERLPMAGGGLDFSPMVAIMILYILRSVIIRL